MELKNILEREFPIHKCFMAYIYSNVYGWEYVPITLDGKLPIHVINKPLPKHGGSPPPTYPVLTFYDIDIHKDNKVYGEYYDIAMVHIYVQNLKPYSGTGFIRIYNINNIPLIISLWDKYPHTVTPGSYLQYTFNIGPYEIKDVLEFTIYTYSTYYGKIREVKLRLAVGHVVK